MITKQFRCLQYLCNNTKWARGSGSANGQQANLGLFSPLGPEHTKGKRPVICSCLTHTTQLLDGAALQAKVHRSVLTRQPGV